MMMWYININKHVIAKNRKHGTNEPPIRFQKGKSGKQIYCHRLKLKNGEIVYSPNKPLLKCGARLIIQTNDEPLVIE